MAIKKKKKGICKVENRGKKRKIYRAKGKIEGKRRERKKEAKKHG